MSSRAPVEINGHRLRLWNRFRWRIGFVPFRRCPGRHRIRNIYGDEIMAAGGMRSRCLDCEKFWPSLMGESNEIGLKVETWAEQAVRQYREIGEVHG
jgi:hypothetical protein